MNKEEIEESLKDKDKFFKAIALYALERRDAKRDPKLVEACHETAELIRKTPLVLQHEASIWKFIAVIMFFDELESKDLKKPKNAKSLEKKLEKTEKRLKKFERYFTLEGLKKFIEYANKEGGNSLKEVNLKLDCISYN